MKTREPQKLLVPVPRSATFATNGELRWPLNWIRGWDRFWFKPSDPVVLGLIRLCTGLVVVYAHLMYSFDLLSYVGPNGWLDTGRPESAAHYLRYDLTFFGQPTDWQTVPYASTLIVGRGHLFWSIFYHMHNPAWIYAAHFGIVAVMILFTVGLWTRVTSVLTWVGAMCYLQRAPTLLFGMDTMMNILLIYLMIGPSGAAVSVDSWLRRRRERAEGLGDRPSPPLATATVAIRLLQVNFCFIYMGSGTSKLLGPAWWNGTAIWGTVANSYFAPLDQAWYLGTLRFLASHRVLWEVSMTAGCAFTLFTEIGLPFLIWNRKWRWWMISAAVLLHAGIGLTMGLVTFSLCMLCMVMSFFPPEAVRELLSRVRETWQRSGEIDKTLPATAGAPLTLTRH
jgi:hypothetical protein